MTGGEEGFKLPGPEDRSYAYSSWRSESENEASRETDSAICSDTQMFSDTEEMPFQGIKSLPDLTQTLPQSRHIMLVGKPG